ncbi:ribonuclease HII [Gemmatimonadetes bacterium T265]|nr:ribonuclease HII [Gemmatimonadetes bacterium T265]
MAARAARHGPARTPGGLRWSELERTLQRTYGPLLAAVDEVGRGPLAGPVVVCALVMPPDAPEVPGVDDSKKLAPEARAGAAAAVRAAAVAYALGAASAREVDALNVYHATVLAMRRALAGLARRLGRAPDHVLVDGKPLRTLGTPHTAVVGGDARCYAVACASVVAKVTRDRLMRALAARHGAYAWERNAGYPTPAHRAAVAAFGPTAHHRRSFLAARPAP